MFQSAIWFEIHQLLREVDDAHGGNVGDAEAVTADHWALGELAIEPFILSCAG